MAQQEKNALLEKLNNLKEENSKLGLDLNKLKRDSQLKQEQDKTLMQSLQEEIKRIRSQ